ncbi:MAG: DNA mismatch repair protein MutS [Saprospiraceae bacterium]|nr:DNA mismatch repair protein MutS [Saprospiraceae bacterium]
MQGTLWPEPERFTPLMQQYYDLKSKHRDAILLFRVGDFYETFGEDAIKTASALDIILTKRNNGGTDVELAGFPYHSLDNYLPKLVKAGYRVAICEQLEKPSKEKKIVKRGVSDIITPGLTADDKLLDAKANHYLASLHIESEASCAVAFLDLSTGEFLTTEGDFYFIEQLIQSFQPKEILIAKSKQKLVESTSLGQSYLYKLEDWVFQRDFCRDKLLLHFATNTLKGFGIEELRLSQIAAGSVLYYLEATEKTQIQHITRISRIHRDQYVALDPSTVKNLELIRPQHDQGKSLLDILDNTVTPMGSRLLRRWILLPLLDKNKIDQRAGVVDYFVLENMKAQELTQNLKQIGDLERLVSKAALGKISPREMAHIRKALVEISKIKTVIKNSGQEYLVELAQAIVPCEELTQRIGRSLYDDLPVALLKGPVIKEGVSEDLDELRHIIQNSKTLLIEIQQKEIQNTNISNLKIGFNNVFGYYLEVTNKHKDQFKIPETWIRKQTLSTGERYITEELKVLEDKILHAEERINDLEVELFKDLIKFVVEHVESLQQNAQIIATLDVLVNFGITAVKNKYNKPNINDHLELAIVQGRHPVIEALLPPEEDYVANDLYLNNEKQQIIIITGPNMSGKSAILRQTALITLMAQIGSFVPAAQAEIGIVDKIFTRVGASDNISSGESTFMVEMNETASILNNISERSLILLDEIGRGTSTYDGISLAWSIAEYLHENEIARPKTLFATHYHELNELANNHDRIKNYHVATKEIGQKVIFLRKLTPGGSHHSFGIHVARMAGMPTAVLERAKQILVTLEKKSIEEQVAGQDNASKLSNLPAPLQMTLVQHADPGAKRIKDELEILDLNVLTPIQCMMKLQEMKLWLERD